MTSQQVVERLRFLNDSAHLLASSAPRTAAFLMSSYNSLLLNNDLEQTRSHRQQTCGACGNIMLIGITATRRVEGSIRKKLKGRPQRAVGANHFTQPQKGVLYSCELCGRQTRQKFSSATTKASYNSSHPRIGNLATGSGSYKSPDFSNPLSGTKRPPDVANPISANASSKKRAKERKQGGLQALLAKKKDIDSRASGGGFGLNLLDLMKKA